MKKRAKRLIALWLAAMMLLCVPVSAAETKSIWIYVGSQSLAGGAVSWSDIASGELELDVPLNEQTAIMERIHIPQGYVHDGWKLWAYDSGFVEDPSSPKALTDAVSSEELARYSRFGHPLLEPLLLLKYKISQQPAAANQYTVKGAVTQDGVSWEEASDITYQWFEANVQKKTYAVAEEDADGAIGALEAEGSYDPETKLWQSASYYDDDNVLFLLFSVRAGDVITVGIPEGSFDGEVFTNTGEELTLEDGVCSATVTEDTEEYMLGVEGASQPFTCSVTVDRVTIGRTALAGQTGAALTAGEDGKQYLCECTFEAEGDAVKLSTDPVTYTHIHTWSADYTTDEDMHWRVCTGCGQKEDGAAHSYENDVCTVCGMINPAHTHRYVEGVCTVCGARDPGMIKSEIASGEDAPTVSSDMKNLEEAVLSPEDREQMEGGANITIRLVVNDASESVKEEDKAATEAAAEGLLTVGRYLDISLVKIIQKDSEMTEASVHDTGKLVRIVIEIPEDMRLADREFSVIRIHNGESTILRDLDDDPDTITIETDRFSSYAIAYQDAKASGGDTPPSGGTPSDTPSGGTPPSEPAPPDTPSSGTSSTDTSGGSEGKQENALSAVSPRTGDTLPFAPYVILLLSAAGMLACLCVRRRRGRHA